VAWLPAKLGVTACAVLALAGTASLAHAAPADPFSQLNDFAPQTNQMGPKPQHKSLQLDSRTGRWGLSIDMSQPRDRDVTWRDARVGLNYRVAPGLRTGVGVSLGDETTPDGRRILPDGPAPRVQLETSFKF
jgi:two component system regulator NtrZ-like protein (phosphatase activity inhibitor)